MADAVAAIDKNRRPLFVALAVDAVARTTDLESIRKWTVQELARNVLSHELGRWQIVGPDGQVRIVDEPHLNLLSLVTITGPKSLSVLLNPSLTTAQLPSKRQCNMAWMSVATGFTVIDHSQAPHNTALLPLEPDILGEAFVVERLLGRLSRAANSVTTADDTSDLLRAAFMEFPTETGEFVHRAIKDFGYEGQADVIQKLITPIREAIAFEEGSK